ncbi:MAG: hypothetical protein ACPGWM_08400, partial [Flavobacteriales bacterium]
MHRTAFLMLSGLLVSFFILSYTVGFQSDIFSRSLYYFLQVSLSLAYLIVLKRKNPSIESSQVFKQGVVFAFAISLLMLLFILLCEFFSILPIIEMLYDGYTDTMIHFFERAVDHEK